MEDRPVRFTDGVGGCGAGCHDREARTAGIVPDGNVAGGHVCDHGRDEVGGYPFRPVLYHLFGLLVLDRETADSGAYIYSEPEAVDVAAFGCIQSGLLHCLVGGSHGEYGEFVLFSCECGFYAVLGRVEILHFSCDPDRKLICREGRDEIYSADSIKQILPESLDIVSDRSDYASACHDYSSLFFHYNQF